VATKPEQVFCWDITYLPAPVRGMHYYLYLFVDIFSRKIVGWQVFDRESAELAASLLVDICERLGIPEGQLTVHSDNGSPMRGETMLPTMQGLGVIASRSRPSVSNDNPYSEALFRTLKYRPELPVRPFEDILHARRWVTDLVQWYNHEHRHSAIKFVTPEQRHAGQDISMLKSREVVYAAARKANPGRWSGATRNWSRIEEVHLNPTTAPSALAGAALGRAGPKCLMKTPSTSFCRRMLLRCSSPWAHRWGAAPADEATWGRVWPSHRWKAVCLSWCCSCPDEPAVRRFVAAALSAASRL
jgi:hypothetical protein